MCGIAGFVMQQGRLPDPSVLEAMCTRIIHRGPDAYGSFTDQRTALGHRRLSIIDLAGGAQPLGNEDGSIQIIFNGEIYNYRELRSGLIERGHQFQTQSDTEVLVHLYEEIGERLPEKLNGMFTFAIWDRKRQELFLARDRFGKKPLYYTTSIAGMLLAFGSELKTLEAIPGFNDELNQPAVADFLSLGYVPDPDCIYRTVQKLPPAHSLHLSSAGIRLRRYWEPVWDPGSKQNLDDTVEEIRELASDAVSRRMISDVPLGGFLSGGVDSSAVVGLMAGLAPERVKTFSIGFTNKEYDELRFARMIATRYQTEHHEEVVTPSMEETFGTLVNHFDEPFGDASAIPTLYLSRLTRQFVTVALSGDGADELFGGYRRYLFGVMEDRIRSKFPSAFRQTVFGFAGRHYPKFDYLPRMFRLRSTLANLATELGDSYFSSISIFRDQGLRDVLSSSFRQSLNGYCPREHYRQRFQSVRHLPPLEQMQAVDLDTYLPGDILVKMDRATMAYSLEGRSPWLDYRLGELSFRLPASWKVHGRIGKYIFKKAVAKQVPEEILTRNKMGFAVPLSDWFRTSLKPMFENLVLHGDMGDILNIEEVRRLWQEHHSGWMNHERKLWNILMLTAWRQRAEKSKNLSTQTALGESLFRTG